MSKSNSYPESLPFTDLDRLNTLLLSFRDTLTASEDVALVSSAIETVTRDICKIRMNKRKREEEKVCAAKKHQEKMHAVFRRHYTDTSVWLSSTSK